MKTFSKTLVMGLASLGLGISIAGAVEFDWGTVTQEELQIAAQAIEASRDQNGVACGTCVYRLNGTTECDGRVLKAPKYIKSCTREIRE